MWILSWLVSCSSVLRLHLHQTQQLRGCLGYSNNSNHEEDDHNKLAFRWTWINVTIAHSKNSNRNEIQAWMECVWHFEITFCVALKFSKLQKKFFRRAHLWRIYYFGILETFLQSSMLIQFWQVLQGVGSVFNLGVNTCSTESDKQAEDLYFKHLTVHVCVSKLVLLTDHPRENHYAREAAHYD